jgi:hypothetical protein
MRAAAKHLARLDREIEVRNGLIKEGLKRSDAKVHRSREMLSEASENLNAAGGEEGSDPGADWAARLIARPVHFSEAYRQRIPISAGEIQAVIDDYDGGGDLGQAALESRHGQLEREVCSAGVGAAFIALLRRLTHPVSKADNFIELLKHGEAAGYTKTNDPLFRKTKRAILKYDGREVMSLQDLKLANLGTGEAEPLTTREQLTELLRTWQAHADFMGDIQTGLWWPPRDIEDFDVPEKGLKRKRLDAALARLRGDDEPEQDAETRRAERDLLDLEYDDGRPSDDQLPLTDLDLPE